MDKSDVCALLAAIAGVLNSLKLLQVKPSKEELESVVMRAFLEGRFDHRKGMTTYEVNGGVWEDCREVKIRLRLRGAS